MTIEAVVLNHTKYGDNHIVIHTLTREYGRRGFIMKAGKKTPTSILMPLSIVDLDVAEGQKTQLWNVRSAASAHPLYRIRGDIYKNTMTLFMSEVLYRIVKDGAREEGLYEWCVSSILTLERMQSDYSNFHIRFLLDLAAALGFRPTFDDILPFAENGRHTMALKAFVQSPFPESMLIPLSGEDRGAIASDLIRYLEHHTESAINIQSLKVLHELYQ